MPVNALLDLLRLILPTLEILGDLNPELTLETPAELLNILRLCIEQLPDADEHRLGAMHLADLEQVLAGENG
jgi:hypothetical protein